MLNRDFFFIINILILYTLNLYFLFILFFFFIKKNFFNKSNFYYNKSNQNILLYFAIVSGIPPFSMFFIKFFLFFFLEKNFNFILLNSIWLFYLNVISIYFYFIIFKFFTNTSKYIITNFLGINKSFNIYVISLIYIFINLNSIFIIISLI